MPWLHSSVTIFCQGTPGRAPQFSGFVRQQAVADSPVELSMTPTVVLRPAPWGDPLALLYGTSRSSCDRFFVAKQDPVVSCGARPQAPCSWCPQTKCDNSRRKQFKLQKTQRQGALVGDGPSRLNLCNRRSLRRDQQVLQERSAFSMSTRNISCLFVATLIPNPREIESHYVFSPFMQVNPAPQRGTGYSIELRSGLFGSM